MCVAWIPLCGLRVLKPNEALVLTLFGKYVGTIKGEGFYAVNPFCVAINPAAKTLLNQSGDVGHATAASSTSKKSELINKKLSLKVMTLNSGVKNAPPQTAKSCIDDRITPSNCEKVEFNKPAIYILYNWSFLIGYKFYHRKHTYK